MIYLDNHATTPCDPRVIEAMSDELRMVGNPSSAHQLGLQSSGRVELAIDQIAEIINAHPSEITLTSGATESNNLAILGLVRSNSAYLSNRRKIVTTALEHKSILAPLQHIRPSWDIVQIPVDDRGMIDLIAAEHLIDQHTALVTVQLANSEIGTIQPIAALCEWAKQQGAIVHCDASQAVGKINVDIDALGVDLLSFCGHKIYGPQGIGALWVRKGIERLLTPLFYGGSSSMLLRPGTKPVSLIVGFGCACKIAIENFERDYQRVSELRDTFEAQVRKVIPGIIINGGTHRLPNNSNITFPGADAEALLSNLSEVIASTNSACESGSVEPSRVLMAIGLSEEYAYQTIRFGFGRFNTSEEIDMAVEDLLSAYQRFAVLS